MDFALREAGALGSSFDAALRTHEALFVSSGFALRGQGAPWPSLELALRAREAVFVGFDLRPERPRPARGVDFSSPARARGGNFEPGAYKVRPRPMSAQRRKLARAGQRRAADTRLVTAASSSARGASLPTRGSVCRSRMVTSASRLAQRRGRRAVSETFERSIGPRRGDTHPHARQQNLRAHLASTPHRDRGLRGRCPGHRDPRLRGRSPVRYSRSPRCPRAPGAGSRSSRARSARRGPGCADG